MIFFLTAFQAPENVASNLKYNVIYVWLNNKVKEGSLGITYKAVHTQHNSANLLCQDCVGGLIRFDNQDLTTFEPESDDSLLVV